MHISFLTRPRCPNSPLLKARLLNALKELGVEATVSLVDVSTLPAYDPRTGYGTPTILVDGTDLFGHPRSPPAGPT